MKRWPMAVVGLVGMLGLLAGPVQAAEITVLGGMGVVSGLYDLAPAFEKMTGHKVIVRGHKVIAQSHQSLRRPHPQHTIVRAMQATVTVDGKSPVSSSRKEVVTYDGSATAKVTITKDGTTKTCTMPLPFGRLECSG